MMNSLIPLKQNTAGLLNFIVEYEQLIGIVGLFIPIVVVLTVFYVRNKVFSNTSKVVKTNANELDQKNSVELVGIDEISNNMFISSSQEIYSGVIETTGIPYRTFSEAEKDGVNAGYIGFLNTINFPFSKHIMSRKIDIENTDNIYKEAYKSKLAEIERQKTNLMPLEKAISKSDNPGEDEIRKYNKVVSKIKMLESDLNYILVQMSYLDSVTSTIQGTTKSSYYVASGYLDEEALKGLSDEAVLEAYENNVSDRLSAMSNSLSNVGVKSNKLKDVELLDLARTHYKPYTSTVYKTKHILNETGIESNFSLNKEIFARVKIHEALQKGAE